MNQYVKIDGFNLNQLIKDYMWCTILGYGTAFLMGYGNYIIKNVSGNEIQKSRNLITVWGFVIITMVLIMSIIENDVLFGLITIAMISLLGLGLLFIIFLFDKKEVNTINNKIKEKEVNKDKKE